MSNPKNTLFELRSVSQCRIRSEENVVGERLGDQAVGKNSARYREMRSSNSNEERRAARYFSKTLKLFIYNRMSMHAIDVKSGKDEPRSRKQAAHRHIQPA